VVQGFDLSDDGMFSSAHEFSSGKNFPHSSLLSSQMSQQDLELINLFEKKTRA
jgi:hypothetical protein